MTAPARPWPLHGSPQLRALRAQWDVLVGLFFREAHMRRGRSFSLGYLASGFEPLIIVATIGLLFTIIGRTAPYGLSLLLFLGTGVFPIYLFIHTSMRLREPLAAGLHRMRYPLEQPLDHILVHLVLHVVSTAAVAIGFFATLHAYGVEQACPAEPLVAIEALASILLLGAAMGIVNSVIARLVPAWDVVWPAIARASLHFSGPYFVAAYLPPNIRYYFGLNPVLHGVNWFRQAFYVFYPRQLTSHAYVLAVAFGMLTVGLLLERGTRRYLEGRE